MITTNDLIKDTDPFIRQKSELVELPLSNENRQLLEAMMEHIVSSQDEELAEQYDLRAGVGLAAIQAGHPLRMCVIHYDDGEEVKHYALVNPKIISHSVQYAYLKDGEGCLSVDNDHSGIVHRYNKITVRGYNLYDDAVIEIKARGYFAIVLQHEIDHFDGKLFYDYINPQAPFTPLENAVEID